MPRRRCSRRQPAASASSGPPAYPSATSTPGSPATRAARRLDADPPTASALSGRTPSSHNASRYNSLALPGWSRSSALTIVSTRPSPMSWRTDVCACSRSCLLTTATQMPSTNRLITRSMRPALGTRSSSQPTSPSALSASNTTARNGWTSASTGHARSHQNVRLAVAVPSGSHVGSLPAGGPHGRPP